MVVHFLSGVAGGFINVFFNLTWPQVLVLGFLMMLFWEIGEYGIGIREALHNRVIDIVVGLAGTALALIIAEIVSVRGEWIGFAVSWGLAMGGMAFGVRAYRRRASATKARTKGSATP